MALVLTDNLDFEKALPNFNRDYFEVLHNVVDPETGAILKKGMLDVSKKKMPQMYISFCKETGKAYLYNKDNEDDPEWGYWRELSSGSANIETYTTVASMKEATVTEDNAVAFCNETDYTGLYVYNVNNESDETTGKWRKALTSEDIDPTPEGDPNDIIYWGNILSAVPTESIPAEGNYENLNDAFFESLFQNANVKSKNKILQGVEYDVSIDETTAVNDLIQHFVAVPTKFNTTENMFDTPYGKLNVGDATKVTTTVNEVHYDVFYWDMCEALRGTYTITLTL